ncbi:hypothetical protein VCR15J2_20388 [Vibrio coralliirubri]|nr:hypothetical protein VCR15J2_20388 [Vibrio coralliirubri]
MTEFQFLIMFPLSASHKRVKRNRASIVPKNKTIFNRWL